MSFGGEACSICHEELRENVAQTACGHLYCAGCLCSWRKLHKRCPLCNASLPDAPRILAPLSSNLVVYDGDADASADAEILALRDRRFGHIAAAAHPQAQLRRLQAVAPPPPPSALPLPPSSACPQPAPPPPPGGSMASAYPPTVVRQLTVEQMERARRNREVAEARLRARRMGGATAAHDSLLRKRKMRYSLGLD